MPPTSHDNQPREAPTSLLSLVDSAGSGMGAALLGLAHRAAAQHRFESVRCPVVLANTGAATNTSTTAHLPGGTP